MLHSLPLEFPLALAFTEQLLTWKLEDGDGKPDEELDMIPASVLLQVVQILGKTGHFLTGGHLMGDIKPLQKKWSNVLTKEKYILFVWFHGCAECFTMKTFEGSLTSTLLMSLRSKTHQRGTTEGGGEREYGGKDIICS